MRFHLGDVLSITTGFLVASSGMEGIYKILNFMTNDSLWTHQLPRAIKECRPHLLRQHPQLKEATAESLAAIPTEWPREKREAGVEGWLRGMVARFGETLEVAPIPADDHERKDPWDELIIMRGSDDGVVPVVIPEEFDGAGEKPEGTK